MDRKISFNTSLVRLDELEKQLGLKAKIYAKQDYENKTGSAKYRPAVYILKGAFERGLLKEGGTIIEATSGNTGIALACAAKDYSCNACIIMPDNMSRERIRMIESYGGQIVLTPACEGMAGAVKKAKAIKESMHDSFIADQFNNPDNVKAHYCTTGPEILNQLEEIDFFVAGIGTGGTISGTGKYIKEKKPDVKIIGVEPLSSPLLTKGTAGAHKIQGIGANFIPSILDTSVIDRIIDVSDEDAYKFTKILAKNKIMCGISSGAAFKAAVEIAMQEENEGKNIVVFLTDSADRYYSTGIYEGI